MSRVVIDGVKEGAVKCDSARPKTVVVVVPVVLVVVPPAIIIKGGEISFTSRSACVGRRVDGVPVLDALSRRHRGDSVKVGDSSTSTPSMRRSHVVDATAATASKVQTP